MLENDEDINMIISNTTNQDSELVDDQISQEEIDNVNVLYPEQVDMDTEVDEGQNDDAEHSNCVSCFDAIGNNFENNFIIIIIHNQEVQEHPALDNIQKEESCQEHELLVMK